MGLADVFDAVNIAPPFTMSSVERTYTSSSGNFPVVTVTARGPTRCQIRNAVPNTASAAAVPISAHRIAECLIGIVTPPAFTVFDQDFRPPGPWHEVDQIGERF